MIFAQSIDPALGRALGWQSRNGWAGYDPYDLRGTPLFLRLNRSRWSSAAFKAASFLLPGTLRLALKIRPQINPKAIALLAHTHLDLYASKGEVEYLAEARKALDWLLLHPARREKAYSGLCWGYPFDWDNRTFIPAGTPSAVVTSIAAEAFERAYELTNEQPYAEALFSCARFIANDLRQDWPAEGQLCFSYTPLDQWHVHNANLFACATLARAAALAQAAGQPQPEWIGLAQAGARYTLAQQRSDGAWAYWGAPDKGLYLVDHYHTGFNLRCLDVLERRLNLAEAGLSEIGPALEGGYHFYVEHFFNPDGLPRYSEHADYPVDIHGCAEALVCLSQLDARFPDAAALAERSRRWTLAHMQAGDGHFYYRRYPFYTIRFPFVRWSQAWMLRGLAAHHLRFSSSSQDHKVIGGQNNP